MPLQEYEPQAYEALEWCLAHPLRKTDEFPEHLRLWVDYCGQERLLRAVPGIVATDYGRLVLEQWRQRSKPAVKIERDMERVAQAVGDENAARVLGIANRPDLSGEKKMEEILRVDPRYAGKDSEAWATLLDVSAAAVRGYKTWKTLQKRRRSLD